MKVLAVVIMLVLSATSAMAADWSWDKADVAREVAGAAITVVDWGQTNHIAGHPDRYLELNPILGAHPSKTAVRNYFCAVIALHPLISISLPKHVTVWGSELSPRLAWQYLYFGVELTATASNWKGGLKIDF